MCDLYTNHLTFDRTGKGLKVAGPKEMSSMPREFSIGFWISPTIFNTTSHFINLFGRASLFATSSNRFIQYRFINGASSSVSPVYIPANQ